MAKAESLGRISERFVLIDIGSWLIFDWIYIYIKVIFLKCKNIKTKLKIKKYIIPFPKL